MNTQEYQAAALRTIYPDLTCNERLSLAGLGLAGETGEVCDLLKKHLHHRNGKALDVAKVTDELGDIMWYFAVLCDTLGISIEDCLQANVAKLETRHANGFNPRYNSDSGVSK